MNIKSNFNKFLYVSCSTLLSVHGFAAPGILEDVPLNISTNVQPNILFLLDDSGSMDWEVLKKSSASADGAHPIQVVQIESTVANMNACLAPDFAWDPNPPLTLDWELYDGSGNIDFTPDRVDSFFVTLNFGAFLRDCEFEWVDAASSQFDAESEVLELCRGYNSTAFDIRVASRGGYTPWVGNDQAGNAYDDQPFEAARQNPWFPAPTSDLNQHFYFVWNDADADDEYDINECGLDFETYDTNDDDVLNLAECTALGDTFCQPVRDLNAVEMTETINGEEVTTTINIQEQYANWFSFYRKREYVAKRAVSEVIEESSSRMGLATLHNNSVDAGGVGTIIEDMRIPTNKNALKNSLFRVDSDSGTPLREKLDQAGEYFYEAGGNTEIGDLFGAAPVHTDTLNTTTPLLADEDGGSCQQNFSIVFSDGFWNGGLTAAQEAKIGNADGDDNTNWDGGSFGDEASWVDPADPANSTNTTLADIAMHYLETDLSTALDNDLNISDQNQVDVTIPHQHLTTYTVAFGVNGRLTTAPVPTDTTFPWTNPLIPNNDPERIDDIQHAAWNGRGQYYNASNPQQLISELIDAANDIDDRTGTAAAASISSGFISAETLVFQSLFDTNDWSGSLLAYRFDNNGVIDLDGNGVINANDALWNASDTLGAADDATRASSRSVFTFNGETGVEFSFPPDYRTLLTQADGTNPVNTIESNGQSISVLNDQQIIGLLSNAPFAATTVDTNEINANQTYGEAIANYFKGDPTNENTLFRWRDNNYLGAIIHSSPQYVGPPNDLYPNLIESGAPYNTFKANNANRTPAVYVGGNDGMLHAFNASLSTDADGNVTAGTGAGTEIFAYIPGTLLENDLHTLAESDYEHLAYVDNSPTIRDIFDGSNWRTFLVGALRTGGKGIYILDVTNPNGFDEADVLAEFDHPELGYTFSRPQIVKMNNDRWAAVFGNGYNSEGCASDGTSCGEAKLFILYLDNLPSDGSTFIENTHYRILRTNDAMVTVANGSCLDTASVCNGLSSPTVADLNGDFVTDRIYAGDLLGNMWVFDVANTNPNVWNVAFGGSPLLTACSDTGNCNDTRQPITVKPEISLHPTRRSFSTAPNVLVYFGTGQFIAEDDELTNDTQSFYAVWDAGGSAYGGLNRDALQAQTFGGSDLSSITVSNNTVDYAASGNSISEAGWYLDLSLPFGTNPFEGARAVINPILSGRVIFFLVTVPSGEICERDGASYLVALDAFDGTQADFNIFPPGDDGTPGNSNPVTEQDTSIVGLGIAGSDPKLVTTGSDGTIGVQDITDGATVPSGRKSWSILR